MSTKNLQSYLDSRFNRWAKITGKGDIINVSDLNQEVADKIFYSLDADMSPENLHCDGEISHREAQKRARLFLAAAAELEKMGFERPADLWEI